MTQNPGRQDKVLAVVNRKGGVAKTTTAINLAHGLSRKLMRRVAPKDLDSITDPTNLFQYQDTNYYLLGHVLLIDFDPQGHCARGLGIDTGKADIGDVLLEQRHITEAVVSADRTAEGFPRPNLWILPASDNLEHAKDILRAQAFAMPSTKNYGIVRILEERLEVALERFTYIVLDCPPALDTFTQAVYQFADSAIVPVKPDYFSMAGTGQHISSIFEAQTRGIDIRIHTIVPTLNVARQKLDQRMVDELKELHGDKVSQPIPRSQAVAEAPAYQQTIFEYDARFLNPATIAYQALVDRVYYG
ncbi:MAG: chromosome partitioning protein ParA [Ardenticatenaceae bacterium]|nr:MAG: chromosome partitioning protein ParA [Ardenticatenaceae bacterium]